MSAPAGVDIVIPMAGFGSRFAKAGFQLPKPLIEVNGKPMIQRVIENLKPRQRCRFVFLVLAQHQREFQLESKLRTWAGSDAVCVTVDKVTEGAACTVLLAEKFLSAERDLIIANSDQLVDMDLSEFLQWTRAPGIDGSIVVFEDTDKKWSFVKINGQGDVIEVAEKKPISNLATVGIYYFRRGTDFVSAAKQMIGKDIRVNGEFYVCPVYNEMIGRSQRLVTWKIEKSAMHGVGTPEDLAAYLRLAR